MVGLNVITRFFSKLYALLLQNLFFPLLRLSSLGGVVAQLVELVTPIEEVSGSIPTVTARSLLVGLVSV